LLIASQIAVLYHLRVALHPHNLAHFFTAWAFVYVRPTHTSISQGTPDSASFTIL
jgi:hypothetical protein